jgi:hypothetical protein
LPFNTPVFGRLQTPALQGRQNGKRIPNPCANQCL